MSEPIDIEAVRSEALRKLGRNIVNFSKIEALLKSILLINQFEMTKDEIVRKEIPKYLEKKRTVLQRQTLGTLVQSFYRDVVSGAQAEARIGDFDISISLKVTYDDPNFLKAQKRALSQIVAERNKLIHQDLALFDTSSVDDCHKLIALLDEQNPRLLDHLQELRAIVKMVVNAFENRDWLEVQNIQSDQSDQLDL